MVSLDKIARLAEESEHDVVSPDTEVNNIDLDKVDSLGDGTKHDVCASSSSDRVVKGLKRIGNTSNGGICHSFTPDGRCVSLFKTLYSNKCTQDCSYCPNSCKNFGGSGYSYTPKELVKVFLALYESNYVEGLFLSSGISRDEDETMENLIETVRLLRKERDYQGYIHLKILPGTDKDYIKRCIELSDRVSLNIETCSKQRMNEISSTKDYKYDILRRQRYIRDLSKKLNLPSGHTTQTIVGVANESDREIFGSMRREYNEMNIRRMYFSSFKPINSTDFSDRDDVSQSREHRLYQVDWLYRVYELEPDEIDLAFDERGYLPGKDPKLKIAKKIFDNAIDPNEASYKRLLRVPGIGPKSAYRIVNYRKKDEIKKRSELMDFGVVMKRARPFLKINGWKDTTLDRWLS